mmetsp:Transcript_35181/g.92057  ORF Transcript_35181/g.92057 Transcript_35181/m.92057 type:complete len:326 (-) Transcript_35181:811-1788(-)
MCEVRPHCRANRVPRQRRYIAAPHPILSVGLWWLERRSPPLLALFRDRLCESGPTIVHRLIGVDPHVDDQRNDHKHRPDQEWEPGQRSKVWPTPPFLHRDRVGPLEKDAEERRTQPVAQAADSCDQPLHRPLLVGGRVVRDVRRHRRIDHRADRHEHGVAKEHPVDGEKPENSELGDAPKQPKRDDRLVGPPIGEQTEHKSLRHYRQDAQDGDEERQLSLGHAESVLKVQHQDLVLAGFGEIRKEDHGRQLAHQRCRGQQLHGIERIHRFPVEDAASHDVCRKRLGDYRKDVHNVKRRDGARRGKHGVAAVDRVNERADGGADDH